MIAIGKNCGILIDVNGHVVIAVVSRRIRWLFRYVITFLRDGTLPEDRSLLAQLYREAAFWNLKQLQIAIEEEKLHLRKEKLADNEKDLWWRKQPKYDQIASNAMMILVVMTFVFL